MKEMPKEHLNFHSCNSKSFGNTHYYASYTNAILLNLVAEKLIVNPVLDKNEYWYTNPIIHQWQYC